ncbi:MAG TPA: NAD-dependent epimerase/dehydratase family protein [Baekduia sp.]|uniref:NAD-dependent epimerase/dehydratase family protein n=1 Tax=Baekduia sp. TaxID=2600305 RepID=UPI002D0DAC56|nr:NAD-dependent epimerase/dehydratase family protein [Baekduia sp.]HMJ36316.1 NAD-dependent epimerase/dehydratase family protein [Baekduia sp.]
MRILVTGGAGFIGSHVVDQLRAEGLIPRVFDVRSSPYHAPATVDQRLGDLRDFDALESATRGCDAVMHLAAAANVDEVVEDPVAAAAVNATGTVNVLEAARRAGVRRVIYASTIWVYAGATGAVDEDTSVGLPEHLYTATKLAGEMYCQSYSALYGLPCTILRFGIPYGPRARPAGVIPIFIRKALAGEALTIAGEGHQSRQFVFVEDLARGVVRALAPQAAGRTYNLVGDENVSVRGIADAVRDLVGDVEVVHTSARPADYEGAQVSGARAAEELGWRAATPFVEGVRRYAQWHTDHERLAPTSAAPRAASRSRRSLVADAVSFVAAFAVLGLLAGYLAAVHAIGLSSHDESTVGLLSFGALAAYLAASPLAKSRLGPAVMFVGWILAAGVTALVVLPGPREAAELGAPEPSLILLGLAGGALSISLADLVLRARQGGTTRPAPTG